MCNKIIIGFDLRMILRITQTSSKFIRPSFASGADDNDLGLKNS